MVVYSKAHWETECKSEKCPPLLNDELSNESHLQQSAGLLVERVVVLQLHRHGFVAVHRRHLDIRGVVHVDGAEEVRGSEACRQTSRDPELLPPTVTAFRVYSPVLVRTRMMASKPMLFCTSFLRSLRKCSPSTSTCRHQNAVGTNPDRRLKPPTERAAFSHLEVAVLVHGASRVRRNVGHGGHVGVLAGEQEEVHAAALRHAVLRQLLVHPLLRLEQSLAAKHTRVTHTRVTHTPGRARRPRFWETLTFSLSVLTSFLSSLFFSLPGASAVGMEEWNMKSFPLHSAAWRRDETRR